MIRLTARMRQFVESYVRCGDSHKAVVMAGYSRKRVRGAAYDLLKNPRIQLEIEKRQKAPIDSMIEKASSVTPEFLVSSLVEALGDIERIGSSGAAMLANRLRCHELIIRCKELQAQAAAEEPRSLAGVTDADLEAAIRALDAKLGLVRPVQEAAPDPEPVPVPDENAPWRATAPANPPSPPPDMLNMPPVAEVQTRVCDVDQSHGQSKWVPPGNGRPGRWECRACKALWAEANAAEARYWGRLTLPADPR